MRILSTLLSVAVLLAAVGVSPVIADDDSKSNHGKDSNSPAATLIVPLTGTVVSGGTFTGSFSISRFENRGGTIHAVGTVSGVVIGPSARSGISGPLALPVTVTSDQPLATQSALAVAQAQVPCQIHVSFGGLTLNLLGVDVTLNPVMLDLVAGSGPLGNVVGQICTLLNTAGNVVGLVTNLLNTLLGLLGGVVGGA
jgi:NADH:ubiquinone oxidoreductase subunit K